ncbi:MAG: hypothetical protein H0W02_00305 [Ktedonobacteraceae bacterium]|nr:hypothetical protein [Ktedonobacteraceae bacterium]
MSEDTAAVSVIINAPVEDVWPLLIEHQQPDEQEIIKSKYVWYEPEGPPVAGQMIHMKLWFLHLTILIQQIVQAEPPMLGQGVFSRPER